MNQPKGQYIKAIYSFEFGLFFLKQSHKDLINVFFVAASFSECFYGLLRVPINPSNEFHSGVRLPELLEKGSLLLLVLGPYIKDKIDQFIEKWREDYEDGKLGKVSIQISSNLICHKFYYC